MEFENMEDHFCLKVAELKSVERNLRQELREKSEALTESLAEIQHNDMLIERLNEENESLMMDARTVKSYRDELDAAIERAEKADRLEIDNARYREKLNAIGLYKTKIEKLHEDKSVLMETKEALEYELNSQKKTFEEEIKEFQLENYRLSIKIDSMEKTFSQKNFLQIQELEKEKKDRREVNEKYEALIATNSELELKYNLVKQEVEILKASLEKQQDEIDDHITLESHFDQLSKDFEKILQERDDLAKNFKNIDGKFQNLRSTHEELELQNKFLESERENLTRRLRNFHHLKEEHVKLKDDFKVIFQKSQLLMAERKSLFEQTNAGNNELKIKMTKMAGELSVKEEICSNLESQIQYLSKRYEELFQENSELKDAKEKLIEHSHMLALQCKEVLEQTIEEKDHFYLEKMTLSETISQMECNKEKLEEKIFEFYKNAPSSTSIRRKSITSNIVKKVKEVSSSWLNKNRRSSSWELHQQQAEDMQSNTENRSTLEPTETMTVGRRLSGKRGIRDRFSLGTCRKEKLTDFSEDFMNSSSPLARNMSLSEGLNHMLEESQDKNTHDDF